MPAATTMLYKVGSMIKLEGIWFDYIIVEDAQIPTYTALGWSATLSEAVANYAAPVPSEFVNDVARGNPNWYNASPLKLKKWRAGLSRVVSKTGNAKIMCVGDSTTFGTGAGTGTNAQVGSRALSWPVRLAELLSKNFNTNGNLSFNYNGGMSVTPNEYSPLQSAGAGWGQSTQTLTGGHFRNSTTTNDLSFTINQSIDRVKVIYAQGTAYGSFTVKINGTTVSTVNAGVNPAKEMSTVISFAASTSPTTITINRVSGTCDIAGVDAYLSTDPVLMVTNAGFHGAKASNFINTANYAAANSDVHIAHAADLLILMLTINDSNQNTAISTYRANMTAFLNVATQQSSVLLMTGFPSNTTNATNGTLQNFINVNYELADQFDIPLLDMNERFGSYAEMNAVIPYADSTHLTSVGYADAATAVAEFVQSMS